MKLKLFFGLPNHRLLLLLQADVSPFTGCIWYKNDTHQNDTMLNYFNILKGFVFGEEISLRKTAIYLYFISPTFILHIIAYLLMSTFDNWKICIQSLNMCFYLVPKSYYWENQLWQFWMIPLSLCLLLSWSIDRMRSNSTTIVCYMWYHTMQ